MPQDICEVRFKIKALRANFCGALVTSVICDIISSIDVSETKNATALKSQIVRPTPKADGSPGGKESAISPVKAHGGLNSQNNVRRRITSPVKGISTELSSDPTDLKDDRQEEAKGQVKSQVVQVGKPDDVRSVDEGVRLKRSMKFSENSEASKKVKVVRKVVVLSADATDKDAKKTSKDRRSLEIYKPPVKAGWWHCLRTKKLDMILLYALFNNKEIEYDIVICFV